LNSDPTGSFWQSQRGRRTRTIFEVTLVEFLAIVAARAAQQAASAIVQGILLLTLAICVSWLLLLNERLKVREEMIAKWLGWSLYVIPYGVWSYWLISSIAALPMGDLQFGIRFTGQPEDVFLAVPAMFLLANGLRLSLGKVERGGRSYFPVRWYDVSISGAIWGVVVVAAEFVASMGGNGYDMAFVILNAQFALFFVMAGLAFWPTDWFYWKKIQPLQPTRERRKRPPIVRVVKESRLSGGPDP